MYFRPITLDHLIVTKGSIFRCSKSPWITYHLLRTHPHAHTHAPAHAHGIPTWQRSFHTFLSLIINKVALICIFIFVYSLDATTYVGRLGRFVNDGVGDEINAKMRKLGASTPHLVLFATKPIQIGEEIRYDYGAKDLWWRKTVGHYATIVD